MNLCSGLLVSANGDTVPLSGIAPFSINLIQCNHAAVSACQAGIARGSLRIRNHSITSILFIETSLILAPRGDQEDLRSNSPNGASGGHALPQRQIHWVGTDRRAVRWSVNLVPFGSDFGFCGLVSVNMILRRRQLIRDCFFRGIPRRRSPDRMFDR